MSALWRYIGLLNAAVWLGGSVFLTFVAGPAFFSADMRELLGPTDYPRLSGGIAGLVLQRYFWFHALCGGIALLWLLGERVCRGRINRRAPGLVIVLLGLTFIGGAWLAPKLGELQRIRHAVTTVPAEREAATKSFRAWHAVSQGMNLLVIGGLLVHLAQAAADRRGQNN
jgi:hypothetical protein